jgi:hypothetical protein
LRGLAVVTAVPGGSLPAPATTLRVYPNPFNPQVTIRYELPAGDVVTLRVFDLGGRRVRTLLEADSQVAGPHGLRWDGRDDAGRAVPSGTYLLRLETDHAKESLGVRLVR